LVPIAGADHEVEKRCFLGVAEFVSVATFPGMGERTIIIDSFSKTYAMTGWRVEWALGPAKVILNMAKLQENVASCVNTSLVQGAKSSFNCFGSRSLIFLRIFFF
jgi:aminotransferase